ncbi:MAG: hypothetical protein ACRCYL_08540, partial [Kluyvera sp.]
MLSLNKKLWLAGLILVSGMGVCTATPLQNCFDSPGIYMLHINQELDPANNNTGKTYDAGHMVAAGESITASCDCPSNMPITGSRANVYAIAFAGSPLPQGVLPGYGSLTETLDVKLSGYTDAINSPEGTGLTRIDISRYPTGIPDMNKITDSHGTSKEEQLSVCSQETRSVNASAIPRRFQWNVISADFYLKKPVFGEETFSPQPVVENYACLYYGSYAGDSGCSVPEKV